MGYTLNVLAEERLKGTLNTRSACMELREVIHAHFSDLRPVYTKEEFLEMSDHWIAARKTYDDLGQPEPDDAKSIMLDHRNLSGECLHRGRIALEMTANENTKARESIHFHYDNLRIHLTESDFSIVARAWAQAYKSYSQHYAETVRLSDDNVIIGLMSEAYYIPWLNEHIEEPVPGIDPDEYWELFLKSRRLIRPADEQRYSQGWHPSEPETRSLPEDFNRLYTLTMYECMKKYGYGVGPFAYDYVHAEHKENGIIQINSSHRVACLTALGYDEIKIILPNEFPWNS